MEHAYKEWQKQRTATGLLDTAIREFVESKFLEYKYLRGCSNEAAENETREQIERLTEGMIGDNLRTTIFRDYEHEFTGRWKDKETS